MRSPTTWKRKWPDSITPAWIGPTATWWASVPAHRRLQRSGSAGCATSARSGSWPAKRRPWRSCASRSSQPAAGEELEHAVDRRSGARRGAAAAPRRGSPSSSRDLRLAVARDRVEAARSARRRRAASSHRRAPARPAGTRLDGAASRGAHGDARPSSDSIDARSPAAAGADTVTPADRRCTQRSARAIWRALRPGPPAPRARLADDALDQGVREPEEPEREQRGGRDATTHARRRRCRRAGSAAR